MLFPNLIQSTKHARNTDKRNKFHLRQCDKFMLMDMITVFFDELYSVIYLNSLNYLSARLNKQINNFKVVVIQNLFMSSHFYAF